MTAGLAISGRAVPAGSVVQPRRSGGLRDDPAALRARFEVDGYLFLDGVLPPALVGAARSEVFARLAEVGEIAAPPDAGIATGTSAREARVGDLGAFWRSVCEGPALRRLTHAEPLASIMAAILGAPAVAFDFLWLRAMAPGRASPPHFDHPYMGRGSARVLTAWLPLGPVPAHDGPLVLVEGSHRFADLIARYRGLDVDRAPAGAEDAEPGYMENDILAIAQARGAHLITTDFAPGDVVVFGMFLLHGSCDNHSRANRVRLSCDVRYQPAADARDERWFGDPPPGHGGNGHDGNGHGGNGHGGGYGAMSGARPMTAEILRR